MANATAIFTSTKSITAAAVVPLRAVARAERFIFLTIPKLVFQAVGLGAVVNNLAEWAGLGDGTAAVTVVQAGQAVAGAEAGTNTWTDFFGQFLEANSSKGYWGMLHYLTSRWSFVCLTMALVMNRISIYGAARNPIRLNWNKRLALRLIPIMLLTAQIHQQLRAVRCQTSPNFSLYRHGDNDIYTILDWSSDGGALHSISSALLFWESDVGSCAAVGFARPEPGAKAKRGSFSLLWPAFLRLSMSHIVESFSCSLQRTQVMTEVGISVFEHSLAFSEAETQIAYTLNKQAAKLANVINASPALNKTDDSIRASGTVLAITDAIHALTGPHPFDRFNVPIEVILIALLSCANALTSNIISVLGKQKDWRLINTAFWGVLYISSFTWGFFTDSTMMRSDGTYPRSVSALLHFPTVAIVGFLPHILVILGIMVCIAIYTVAVLFTAVSLGTNPAIPQPVSLMQRFNLAHENLQASIPLKAISVKWHDDFYTALLRVGFAALTAASEAVFLNEGRQVEMRQFTWLEEEHLDELDKSRVSQMSVDEQGFQIVEERGVPGIMMNGQRQVGEWRSGYERERKLEKKNENTTQDDGQFIYPNPRTDGVGALQRTTRFYLLFIFLRGIIFTVGGWIGYGVGTFLDRMGVTARPMWLKKVIGVSLKQQEDNRKRRKIEGRPRLEYWTVSREGHLEAPTNEDVDLETVMRARIHANDSEETRSVLDQTMYDWWKNGGWFGVRDDSGEYQPPHNFDEWDDTSVVTDSVASMTDRDWESEPDGYRTPTQSSTWSFNHVSRAQSETPEPEIFDTVNLARLLNPQDAVTREEARILSSHLVSTGPVTRSRYHRQFARDRNQMFTAGRYTYDSTGTRRPLSHEEELNVLEKLLISRREQKAQRTQLSDSATTTTTINDDNSASFAVSGPLCVVCHSEPRTIIAWPCRCLTVCEDCRINLAMNNFGNCVTCRRSVGGFVRLYVP